MPTKQLWPIYFKSMIKPGGLLVIDHRNYDALLDRGCFPVKNIYYDSGEILSVKFSLVYADDKVRSIVNDFTMNMLQAREKPPGVGRNTAASDNTTQTFRISAYPHRLKEFTALLKDVFGPDTKHRVYADFKPLDQEEDPAYYIHVLQKVI